MDKHKHSHDYGHAHSHGVIDPSIITHERGLWAVKWSFIWLMVTALFQVIVVVASKSVALFADTIHNFADASTAIPLGIAFVFARFKPTKRFTYGYGRVEDLAGVLVVLTILFSAVVAGYEAIQRFFHTISINYLWAVALASILGFVGNEAVAIFRIRVGKEIGSAALVADGYHARVDGFTIFALLIGAIGVWLGFPFPDPVIVLFISAAIFLIVWQSAKEVFTRMLDGVDPEVLHEVIHAAEHVKGVTQVGDIKARWVGHKLYVELNIAVGNDASVKEGHELTKKVRHELLHHLPHLGHVMIHVDPENDFGEKHFKIGQ